DTTHHVDIPMQTDDDDDGDDRHQRKPPPSVEASPSDVLLPPNALSRARPSFIPSGNAADITMDESYCPPSPEPVKLEASDSKRNTLAVPVPMEVLAAAPPSRQTILNEEKIVLDVPTSRLNPVRHTVFGAQMELAGEKEEERKRTALPQMETVKVDLADLVFARNSIGLDLVPAVATPAEANRPKIHRIAPRALGFNFGEATPSTSGSVKPVEAPKQPPRVTIYSGDVVEQTRIEEVEVREPRKTIVQSLDVSMASPVEEPSAPKTRGTVFVSEDVNESVVEPAVKQNHLRPTMLFNEKLEVSKLEPRSGSLEDLRRYGQSRKSILSSGDDVIIVLDSPDVTGRMSLKSGHRGTLLASGDMDRTRRTPSPVERQEQVVSKSRQTMADAVSMEQTMAANSSISPVTVPSRITVYDADRMDETRIKDMISPEVFVQPVAPKSRQTCYQAEMDETVPIGRSVDAVPNPSRKSVLNEVNMDETRGVVAVQQQSMLQKPRQTSFDVQDMNETKVAGQPVEMDETARTANRTLQKSRQTSFAAQDMNRTASPDVPQSVTQHVEMDETCRQDALEQSKASRTLPKSRQTSFAAQDMNVTRTGSPVDQQQDALEQSKASRTLPKSRQTSFAAQNMNVTRAASPVDQQVAMDETGTASKSRQTSFAVQDMNQTGRPSVVQQVEADSGLLQKSRQTNFTAQDVNETGVIQQVDKSSRALEKSRQTSYAALEMNRSPVVTQHVEMDESLRPDPLEQSKASRTLQKSRQTSFAVQDMNETRARSSPSKVEQLEIDETARTFNRTLQKSRQTSFAVQDMNQTGRVSPNLRQSEVEMDGTSPAPAWQLSRSQFATSKSTLDPLEQSKALQKSRQTSFVVEQMDQTLAGHAKSVVVEHLQKSNRQTVYQEAEMEQTRRDFGNQLEVDDQNTRLSRLEHSRASRIPRHTSFAVQDMNETGVARNGSEEVATKSWQLSKSTLREEVQKSRQTSFSAENMDETSVESSRLQKTSSNISNLQKSRQTTFQPAEMDQTRCQSPLHIEETILQSPQRADDHQAPSLFHSTNHSTVVERTRQTVIFNDGDDADDGYGTVPIGQQQQVVATSFSSPHLNLEQSIKRHSVAAASSRPRHTIYAQESMEETTVGMARISDGCRLVVEEEERQKRTPPPAAVEKVGVAAATKSRKTVYCEDDMEQTTVGFRLRRVAEVESPVFKEPSPVKERAPSPEVVNHATVPSQPIRSRQTILAPQDMEQSLMQQSMEVSVIKSTPRKAEVSHQQQHPHHPPRRTIMLSEGITEESFQQPERPFKLEQTASPCPSDQDYEESLTVELKQEDKSDFSFTMPALPEDRVLRSSAVIPAYRMAPVGRIGPAGKSLVPEELNTTDVLVPQGGRMFPGVVRVPMDELSEISGLADTSRLCRPARPVSIMAGDVSSFALLKEVTEPSILHPVDVVVPSVPTSVIQETPRKTSMIPVARRSRGSIFNRQSVDMDMSGVTVMEGGTPESEEKGVEEEKIEVPIESEPTNLNASEEDEFYDAETNPVLEEREVPVAPTISDQSTMMHMDVNQTAAGLKTLKFIDVDELEQTQQPQQQQKRLLSQISKSVLLEQEENDPLNVSLSDDYPLKKRKTVAVPTPAKDPLTVTEEDKPPRKSLRRVTFQPELELETVTIKKECDTIVEANETYAPEESRFDPSVFIVEESDMLANESNISLVVASPTAHESSSSRTTTRASTSKYDNSIYREYGNLTLNVDQLGSTSCIVISDDSITETKPTPAQLRLTLADLPKRIRKSRESLVLNSTVASEVMYELNHEVTAAKQLPQRPRRTMAAVRQETVETVREAWETNFGRILESVVDVATKAGDLPLDERIREILGRPMKEALPLPQCLERGLTGAAGQLPEVPSIWFLSENFLRTTLSDAPTSSSEVFTPCHLPATPSSTTLVRNRLETQGFRWFLDSSCEASERRLYLRHRTLRTLKMIIHLQKIPSDCCHHDRIERLELVECWRQAVPSTRLLAAHAEFMEIGPKNVRDVLSSMCTSTGHLMSLVVHLDTLVEQVLGKVDALWRIVKNNGAVLEEFGTDRRLRISKYFEYQHGQTVHWNRLEVQFDAIDRIERSSVSFHRSDLHQHCASLFPTEQQCGKSGLQGLVFLECLLWNVEKLALEC
ncbi:hypothetical protein pipiens_013793, partial [Culex pipiens pipiens]